MSNHEKTLWDHLTARCAPHSGMGAGTCSRLKGKMSFLDFWGWLAVLFKLIQGQCVLLKRVSLQFALRETFRCWRNKTVQIVWDEPGKRGLERLFAFGFFHALGLNLSLCKCTNLYPVTAWNLFVKFLRAAGTKYQEQLHNSAALRQVGAHCTPQIAPCCSASASEQHLQQALLFRWKISTWVSCRARICPPQQWYVLGVVKLECSLLLSWVESTDEFSLSKYPGVAQHTLGLNRSTR